jgi:hypothetical protein
MWLRSVSLKKRRASEDLFAFDAHDNRAASSAMADAKSRGIDVVKLCRNKPLSDAHRSSIMALLKDGADLNVRYGPGNTALHFAAEKGHADVVKELLAKGADPICPNDEGKTPIDFARMTGNSEIAKILETSKKKMMLQTASPQSSSSSNITATSGKAQSNAEASPPAALQEPEPVQHAPDAATQPKVLSPAERKALENIITTTASLSLLPPNVTSIGCVFSFTHAARPPSIRLTPWQQRSRRLLRPHYVRWLSVRAPSYNAFLHEFNCAPTATPASFSTASVTAQGCSAGQTATSTAADGSATRSTVSARIVSAALQAIAWMTFAIGMRGCGRMEACTVAACAFPPLNFVLFFSMN